MYTVAKKFTFAASHHHTKLPEGHPCRRNHGHNWEVEIGFEVDSLDEHDFVIDYGAIREVAKPYLDQFDHQDLNEVLHGVNPSCENLAKLFFTDLSKLFDEQVNQTPSFVRVCEAPGTYAEYRPTK